MPQHDTEEPDDILTPEQARKMRRYMATLVSGLESKQESAFKSVDPKVWLAILGAFISVIMSWAVFQERQSKQDAEIKDLRVAKDKNATAIARIQERLRINAEE